MSASSRIRSWWKALAHRSIHDGEMEAELQLHIESYAADLVREGAKPEEAMRRARIELGSIAVQRENCRESLGLRMWDDLTGDVRYAFRQLRRPCLLDHRSGRAGAWNWRQCRSVLGD